MNFKFDLKDDLDVDDLHKVELWKSRLYEIGKLRLQRSGKELGVLLSPTAWRTLKEQTERYEHTLRILEDERDRRIVADREGGSLLQGKKLNTALERELKEDGLL